MLYNAENQQEIVPSVCHSAGLCFQDSGWVCGTCSNACLPFLASRDVWNYSKQQLAAASNWVV